MREKIIILKLKIFIVQNNFFKIIDPQKKKINGDFFGEDDFYIF